MKKLNNIESPLDRLKNLAFDKEKNRAEPPFLVPEMCKNCGGYGDECICEIY